MRDMADKANDFFVPDEPVAKIKAAFEKGEKRLTGRAPASGQIQTRAGLYQHLRAGLMVADSSNRRVGNSRNA